MFHLKVHHAVERILVIKNNALVGEMQYVTTIEEKDESGQMEKIRVFNGTTDGEIIIALIVGKFGTSKITCDKLFSRILTLEKEDNDEYADNFVLINWCKPNIETPDKEIPAPDVCILDFPQSLTEILDMPPMVLIPKFE